MYVLCVHIPFPFHFPECTFLRRYFRGEKGRIQKLAFYYGPEKAIALEYPQSVDEVCREGRRKYVMQKGSYGAIFRLFNERFTHLVRLCAYGSR